MLDRRDAVISALWSALCLLVAQGRGSPPDPAAGGAGAPPGSAAGPPAGPIGFDMAGAIYLPAGRERLAAVFVEVVFAPGVAWSLTPYGYRKTGPRLVDYERTWGEVVELPADATARELVDALIAVGRRQAAEFGREGGPTR